MDTGTHPEIATVGTTDIGPDLRIRAAPGWLHVMRVADLSKATGKAREVSGHMTIDGIARETGGITTAITIAAKTEQAAAGWLAAAAVLLFFFSRRGRIRIHSRAASARWRLPAVLGRTVLEKECVIA